MMEKYKSLHDEYVRLEKRNQDNLERMSEILDEVREGIFKDTGIKVITLALGVDTHNFLIDQVEEEEENNNYD